MGTRPDEPGKNTGPVHNYLLHYLPLWFVMFIGGAITMMGGYFAYRFIQQSKFADLLTPVTATAMGVFVLFLALRAAKRRYRALETALMFLVASCFGAWFGFEFVPKPHSWKAAFRASCQNDLKQLGLVCMMYQARIPIQSPHNCLVNADGSCSKTTLMASYLSHQII
jgi:hypothetical protein